MAHKFTFLSSDFYNDYPENQYSEIERKHDRPYIQICVSINGVDFAIPLRSGINHNHVLWTGKQNHCGVDFSKAVVIGKSNYLDKSRTPYIRQDEFNVLKGKEYIIKQKMEAYIKKYKKAKSALPRRRRKPLVSTMGMKSAPSFPPFL